AAEDLVRVAPILVAAGEDHTHRGALADVVLHAHDAPVGRLDAARDTARPGPQSLRRRVEQADAPVAGAAGEPGAPLNRHRKAVGGDADAPREEELERRRTPDLARRHELEDPGVLQEELPLLLQEQGKA